LTPLCPSPKLRALQNPNACWDNGAGGCGANSGDTVAAIDQAVIDGVDVLNFSISGTSTNYLDSVEVAFLFAARAGVFVATSAGNSGPTASTVAHISPWLASVAAGTHDRSGTATVILGNGAKYNGASLTPGVGPAPVRIFALSDIHVDYSENMAWIQGLSERDYSRDVLLLAGDICHDIGKLEAALKCLREKFAEVFFLNGNHDLWLLETDSSDSRQKFHRLLDLCRGLGVRTEPAKLDDGHGGLWIVPLFAWYDKPEETQNSLFLPKAGPGDEMLDSWGDEHFVRWPAGGTPSAYFLESNVTHLHRVYDAPVISFSHFLPRTDLMFPRQPGAGPQPTVWPLRAGFNFSRVAGTWALEKQIRKLGSRVHAYGHQHRNRWVTIDGIHYVSHCLGYPHERKSGRIGYFEAGPRLIWEHGRPAVPIDV